MARDDQRRVIVDQPGMTSVVTKEYLQIWGSDVMIPKHFFKWWSAAMILLGICCGFFILLYMVGYVLANLWLLLPVGFMVFAGFLVRRWYYKKPKGVEK